VLSELARCPAIRLLASSDHVNAGLLWDKRTADRFNWLYFDITTYASYEAEAREMPSLLVGRRCAPPNVSVLPRGGHCCQQHNCYA
jgi:origin recognition complex subunit 2